MSNRLSEAELARLNLSALEEIEADATGETVASSVSTKATRQGDPKYAPFEDKYFDARKYGSFITRNEFDEYAKFLLNQASLNMGNGPYENNMQSFLSRLDRHGTVITPVNSMNYGYTFITRPRLNLTGANLHQHPVLATLYASNPKSVITMIRALLDTRLSRGSPLYLGPGVDLKATQTDEVKEFSDSCTYSPLIDVNNPFLVPCCNGLMGISGFPDLVMETERNEGDFHNGNEIWIKGSDLLNASQELSLEFRDVQGSIIMSIFYYWCLYMALQAKGVVMAYPDDIYEQRLNYTVSIYRFVTDMTRENILWWAKATGCFPTSVPIGGLFNVDHDTPFVTSAMRFSVPFAANKIEVNDPGILSDFNTLVERYEPDIATAFFKPVTPNDTVQNFNALPFVVANSAQGVKLQWRTADRYKFKNDIGNPSDAQDDAKRREAASVAMLNEVIEKRDARIREAVRKYMGTNSSL